MKYLLKFLVILFILSQTLFAQSSVFPKIDSLINELNFKSDFDTTKVNIFAEIAYSYSDKKPDEGIAYGMRGIELAEKINFKKGLASVFNALGICYYAKAEYDVALDYDFKSLKIYEELNLKKFNSNKLS